MCLKGYKNYSIQGHFIMLRLRPSLHREFTESQIKFKCISSVCDCHAVVPKAYLVRKENYLVGSLYFQLTELLIDCTISEACGVKAIWRLQTPVSTFLDVQINVIPFMNTDMTLYEYIHRKCI